MEYQDLIDDFAERTLANLHFIEERERAGDSVYEVTQLMNSMLGLLVFPQQHCFGSVPATPLDKLTKLGWPRIDPIEGALKKNNLRELTRVLRNAITHCNVEFVVDEDRNLTGLRVWNEWKKEITWKAELSLSDLRQFAEKFAALIITQGALGDAR